jgi:hypothetical protein
VQSGDPGDRPAGEGRPAWGRRPGGRAPAAGRPVPCNKRAPSARQPRRGPRGCGGDAGGRGPRGRRGSAVREVPLAPMPNRNLLHPCLLVCSVLKRCAFWVVDDGSLVTAGRREGVGEAGRGAGCGRQVQDGGWLRCGGEVGPALGCFL